MTNDLELEADLRDAVDRMAFELHYQPQLNVRTGQVQCFEALLRWSHLARGSVPPDTFMPLAEKLGLMNRISDWVLRTACTDARSWPDRICVAVNVSSTWFDGGALAASVRSALQLTGLPPARLELELTETYMLRDMRSAADTFARLRTLGVRMVMDDFGTGYSSLSNLRHLPFDKVKIDRSFTEELGHGSVHTALVRTIIDLCATLGVTCVAEGVETEEQLAVLARENCSEMQGFLLGRPRLAAEVPQVIATVKPHQAASVALPRKEGFFSEIINNTNDIVIVTTPELKPPGPTIIYVNSAFTRLTGYTADEALGSSPRMLQGPGTSCQTLERIRAGLREGREVHEKILNFAKNGAPYWLDLRIIPIRDTDGNIVQFAAIERDVTLDKRRLDELEYFADRDTLTGIPNRRAFIRNMNAELQAARSSHGTRPCLAYIDVDHFKSINDRHGHLVGDEVLCGIADRLEENVRRVDMAGRFGGEEFAVCLPSVSLADAEALGERLRHAIIAQPFPSSAGPLEVTVSIGVAEAHWDESSLSAILQRADQAMYAAKRAGRNCVQGSAAAHAAN